MSSLEEGVRLSIYLGESDHYQGHPAYEQVVLKAREMGMAGATVLRGIEGYGLGSRIHTARLLRLSEDMPIVVEVVDTEERISRFLPFLDEVIGNGMATLEPVRVIRYRTKH